ncbi:hypothetical protein ABBQ38_012977 [Trebouxia sp. C0009 RCD-2024]
MFGLPSRNVVFSCAYAQHFPPSFRLSANRMRPFTSHPSIKPMSQHAVRAALVQQGRHQGKATSTLCLAAFSGRNADSEFAGGGSSIPQPQASNAGSSSTNTSKDAPTTASSNGASSGQQADQHQQHSSSAISDLQGQVSKLSELVTNKARMLEAQVKDLEHARSLIDMHAITNTLSASAPTQTIKAGWHKDIKPFEVQRSAIGDRRYLGGYDARFHSTNKGATPRDHRILPRRIILVRHAESEGNIDNFAYTYVPDPQVPLTLRGLQQAEQAGKKIKQAMDSDGMPYNLFFYTSPYKRSRQTHDSVSSCFAPDQLKGVQEEVQLREQDFGNFQDAEGKQREKAERLRFGRFFYRFPNGESGADVYDRMTIFEDHMIRDINAGRFRDNTSLVLLTHGLALRVFLMRWFHWTVDQFMNVYNPPNAEPLILERIPEITAARTGGPVAWIHTKALYRLTEESKQVIQGCTDEMCSTSHAPSGAHDVHDGGI